MILVILGTQDKDFSRLLLAVEKQIKTGNINEKVVVQAGQTKFQSDYMEVFDFLSAPEFDSLMREADLIITHGGVGSILGAIKYGKRVIAAARLAKYDEHHNDHQKQIINEFVKKGYILELKDFNKLDVTLKKAISFRPKKFESNNVNFIKKLDDYIESENHVSWLNKYIYIFKHFFILLFYTVLIYLIKKIFPNIEDVYIFKYHYILFFAVSYFLEKRFIFGKCKNKFWIDILMFVSYVFVDSLLFVFMCNRDSFILFQVLFFFFTIFSNKLIFFKKYVVNN